ECRRVGDGEGPAEVHGGVPVLHVVELRPGPAEATLFAVPEGGGALGPLAVGESGGAPCAGIGRGWFGRSLEIPPCGRGGDQFNRFGAERSQLRGKTTGKKQPAVHKTSHGHGFYRPVGGVTSKKAAISWDRGLRTRWGANDSQ